MAKDSTQRLLSNIPNTATLCNLLLGCLSLIFASRSQFNLSFYCILFGGIFDLIDGYLARKLNVSSQLGKELDSLADMVTFGIAPFYAVFLYYNPISELISWLTLIFPLLVAIRLAKFNVSTPKDSKFSGLPSPIFGITLASIPTSYLHIATSLKVFLICFMLLSSVFMVLKISYPKLNISKKWLISLLLILFFLSLLYSEILLPIYLIYLLRPFFRKISV